MVLSKHFSSKTRQYDSLCVFWLFEVLYLNVSFKSVLLPSLLNGKPKLRNDSDIIYRKYSLHKRFCRAKFMKLNWNRVIFNNLCNDVYEHPWFATSICLLNAENKNVTPKQIRQKYNFKNYSLKMLKSHDSRHSQSTALVLPRNQLLF